MPFARANHARLGLRRLWVTALLVLSGCAVERPTPLLQEDGRALAHWQGKIAITVHETPVRSLSAAFDLQGNPSIGCLYLYAPWGSTLAQLEWDAQSARLRTSGQPPQTFDSLASMLEQTTGVALPIASIFDWLHGSNAAPTGWEVDTSAREQGVLRARKIAPAPPADLKLIFER